MGRDYDGGYKITMVNSTHISIGFPTPPHLMVRPSILIVGPFIRNKRRTKLIWELIRNLQILQQTIPHLHLILAGPGATDCFNEQSKTSLILEDSEENIESYVFYSNALIHFRAKSVLQTLAINYANRINCPVIKYPLFRWGRNENEFLDTVTSTILSPSNLLTERMRCSSQLNT
jgi:hypothetical protein